MTSFLLEPRAEQAEVAPRDQGFPPAGLRSFPDFRVIRRTSRL